MTVAHLVRTDGRTSDVPLTTDDVQLAWMLARREAMQRNTNSLHRPGPRLYWTVAYIVSEGRSA